MIISCKCYSFTRWSNELRLELFNPPYLFNGERPRINKVPSTIKYGNSFEIESDIAEDIISVALIRPSVTTHCVNVDQRYVGLEFDKIHSTLNHQFHLIKN